MWKPTQPIQQIRGFYHDVVSELKKCTWPSRDELTEATVVVIVSVVILSMFVAVADGLLSQVLIPLMAGS